MRNQKRRVIQVHSSSNDEEEPVVVERSAQKKATVQSTLTGSPEQDGSDQHNSSGDEEASASDEGDDEPNAFPAEDLSDEGAERKKLVKDEDKARAVKNDIADERFFKQDVDDTSHLLSSHDDTNSERQRKRRKTDEAVARLERSNNAVVQENERTDMPYSANDPWNQKPMVELEAGSNTWYQAYLIKETANEVKLSIPIEDPSTNKVKETRVVWFKKGSSRIWRGSMRSSDWLYLTGGAWRPRSSTNGGSHSRKNRSKGSSQRKSQPQLKHTHGYSGSEGNSTDHTNPGQSIRRDDEAMSPRPQQRRASSDVFRPATTGTGSKARHAANKKGKTHIKHGDDDDEDDDMHADESGSSGSGHSDAGGNSDTDGHEGTSAQVKAHHKKHARSTGGGGGGLQRQPQAARKPQQPPLRARDGRASHHDVTVVNPGRQAALKPSLSDVDHISARSLPGPVSSPPTAPAHANDIHDQSSARAYSGMDEAAVAARAAAGANGALGSTSPAHGAAPANGLGVFVRPLSTDPDADPLARWFIRHMSTLAATGVLSSTPDGSLEAGSLPAGFVFDPSQRVIMQHSSQQAQLTVKTLQQGQRSGQYESFVPRLPATQDAADGPHLITGPELRAVGNVVDHQDQQHDAGPRQQSSPDTEHALPHIVPSGTGQACKPDPHDIKPQASHTQPAPSAAVQQYSEHSSELMAIKRKATHHSSSNNSHKGQGAAAPAMPPPAPPTNTQHHPQHHVPEPAASHSTPVAGPAHSSVQKQGSGDVAVEQPPNNKLQPADAGIRVTKRPDTGRDVDDEQQGSASKPSTAVAAEDAGLDRSALQHQQQHQQQPPVARKKSLSRPPTPTTGTTQEAPQPQPVVRTSGISPRQVTPDAVAYDKIPVVAETPGPVIVPRPAVQKDENSARNHSAAVASGNNAQLGKINRSPSLQQLGSVKKGKAVVTKPGAGDREATPPSASAGAGENKSNKKAAHEGKAGNQVGVVKRKPAQEKQAGGKPGDMKDSTQAQRAKGVLDKDKPAVDRQSSVPLSGQGVAAWSSSSDESDDSSADTDASTSSSSYESESDEGQARPLGKAVIKKAGNTKPKATTSQMPVSRPSQAKQVEKGTADKAKPPKQATPPVKSDKSAPEPAAQAKDKQQHIDSAAKAEAKRKEQEPSVDADVDSPGAEGGSPPLKKRKGLKLMAKAREEDGAREEQGKKQKPDHESAAADGKASTEDAKRDRDGRGLESQEQKTESDAAVKQRQTIMQHTSVPESSTQTIKEQKPVPKAALNTDKAEVEREQQLQKPRPSPSPQPSPLRTDKSAAPVTAKGKARTPSPQPSPRAAAVVSNPGQQQDTAQGSKPLSSLANAAVSGGVIRAGCDTSAAAAPPTARARTPSPSPGGARALPQTGQRLSTPPASTTPAVPAAPAQAPAAGDAAGNKPTGAAAKLHQRSPSPLTGPHPASALPPSSLPATAGDVSAADTSAPSNPAAAGTAGTIEASKIAGTPPPPPTSFPPSQPSIPSTTGLPGSGGSEALTASTAAAVAAAPSSVHSPPAQPAVPAAAPSAPPHLPSPTPEDMPVLGSSAASFNATSAPVSTLKPWEVLVTGRPQIDSINASNSGGVSKPEAGKPEQRRFGAGLGRKRSGHLNSSTPGAGAGGVTPGSTKASPVPGAGSITPPESGASQQQQPAATAAATAAGSVPSSSLPSQAGKVPNQSPAPPVAQSQAADVASMIVADRQGQQLSKASLPTPTGVTTASSTVAGVTSAPSTSFVSPKPSPPTPQMPLDENTLVQVANLLAPVISMSGLATIAKQQGASGSSLGKAAKLLSPPASHKDPVAAQQSAGQDRKSGESSAAKQDAPQTAAQPSTTVAAGKDPATAPDAKQPVANTAAPPSTHPQAVVNKGDAQPFITAAVGDAAATGVDVTRPSPPPAVSSEQKQQQPKRKREPIRPPPLLSTTSTSAVPEQSPITPADAVIPTSLSGLTAQDLGADKQAADDGGATVATVAQLKPSDVPRPGGPFSRPATQGTGTVFAAVQAAANEGSAVKKDTVPGGDKPKRQPIIPPPPPGVPGSTNKDKASSLDEKPKTGSTPPLSPQLTPSPSVVGSGNKSDRDSGGKDKSRSKERRSRDDGKRDRKDRNDRERSSSRRSASPSASRDMGRDRELDHKDSVHKDRDRDRDHSGRDVRDVLGADLIGPDGSSRRDKADGAYAGSSGRGTSSALKSGSADMPLHASGRADRARHASPTSRSDRDRDRSRERDGRADSGTSGKRASIPPPPPPPGGSRSQPSRPRSTLSSDSQDDEWHRHGTGNIMTPAGHNVGSMSGNGHMYGGPGAGYGGASGGGRASGFSGGGPPRSSGWSQGPPGPSSSGYPSQPYNEYMHPSSSGVADAQYMGKGGRDYYEGGFGGTSQHRGYPPHPSSGPGGFGGGRGGYHGVGGGGGGRIPNDSGWGGGPPRRFEGGSKFGGGRHSHYRGH